MFVSRSQSDSHSGMKKLICFIIALTITSLSYGAPKKWDWFTAMDKDKDGKVTETEWVARAKNNAEKQKKKFNEKNSRNYFNRVDADNNGTVSRKELEAATAKNQKNKSK